MALAGLMACMGLFSAADAQAIKEDFNNYTDGVAFPASEAPDWASNGTVGTGLDKKTARDAESPFTANPNGLGFLLTDVTASKGASSGIKLKLPSTPTDAKLRLSFDYKVLDHENNDLSLQVILGSDTTQEGVPSSGPFLVLWDGKNYDPTTKSAHLSCIKTPVGEPEALANVKLDTWYHVEVVYNLVDTGRDSFSVSVPPSGGKPTTFEGNPFRNNLASVDYVLFINNSNNESTGSWALDNISLVVEP